MIRLCFYLWISMGLLGLCKANAQQPDQPERKFHETWVRIDHEPWRIKGYLYQVTDSAVFISHTSKRTDFLAGNFELIRFNYNEIERVHVSNSSALLLGALGGGILAGSVTYLVLRSAFGSDWGNLFSIIIVPPAFALGAIVVGIVTSQKYTFRINGSYNNFLANRNQMSRYAYIASAFPVVPAMVFQENDANTDQNIVQIFKDEESPSATYFSGGFLWGPSIPAGDFADSSADNENAGFADTGAAYRLKICYDISENLGISLIPFYHVYHLSDGKAEKWRNTFDLVNPDAGFTYYQTLTWEFLGAKLGAYASIPLHEKWIAELGADLGYVATYFHGDQFQLQKGGGQILSSGVMIRYKRSAQWSILFDSRYFYTLQSMRYKNGLSGPTEKQLQGANLGFGLAFRF